MTRVYRAEVKIEAPVTLVWSVLTDFEAYPHWNPFTPKASGALEVGAPIVLEVMLGKRPSRQTEHIRAIEAPSLLAWGMAWAGGLIVRGERRQTVTASGDGGSLYVTEDTISGLAEPLVRLLYGRQLHAGFEAMAAGLKTRAESLNRSES
jgi:uncharacterized protein YndB with AHSA1/START domain